MTRAISFGNYNPLLGNAVNATGQLTYRCNRPFPVSVIITLSTGLYGTYDAREMGRLGVTTDRLQYNLFLDAGCSTVWGDLGLGAGHYYTATVTSRRNIRVTIYGRIPAGLDPVQGSYNDQVVSTFYF